MKPKCTLAAFYADGKGLNVELIQDCAEVRLELAASRLENRDACFQEAGDKESYIFFTREGLLFYNVTAVVETNIITRPGLVKP